MARTLVITKAEGAGKSFSFNEEIQVTSGNFNAVVQFYRSKPHAEGKYGKADNAYNGEFGFDKFDKTVMAEGLIKHFTVLNGVEAKKETLKNNHQYLCSYLTICPPGVKELKFPLKYLVTLYVKAERNSNKSESTDVDTEEVELEISDPESLTIVGARNGIKKLPLTIDADPIPITIECLKPFKEEITITAKAEGNIIGRLIVLPNAKIYKTLIQPVRIKFSDTESKTEISEPNSPFIQSLVQDFNSKSFNQALIFAELAADTKVITLDKSKFSDYLFKAEDGNTYLIKESESDNRTLRYNNLVESRYAAILAGEVEKNKAEQKLKEKIQQLLEAFDKRFKFNGTGLKYTLKQYKNKIATNAWGHKKVVKAYHEYLEVEKEYEKLGSAVGLDKQHKLHLFITNDIYAAKNPTNKVLAYSNLGKGVAHIFDYGLKDTAAIPVVLHELGHSLSLEHTFSESLQPTIIREPGKVYKEDLDEEIEKGKEEIRKLKADGDNEKNISNLAILYKYRLNGAISSKSSFQKEDANYFRAHFLNLVQEAISIESKPLESNHGAGMTLEAINSKIKIIEAKIEGLKEKKRNADKRQELPVKNTQSATDENYMDYVQNTSGHDNRNMQRKTFYKWQWDEMQYKGIDFSFLHEINLG